MLQHTSLPVRDYQTAKDFYVKALAAGGKDNGAHGFRTDYDPDYYAAFVLDPDGHNIEACYFGKRIDS